MGVKLRIPKKCNQCKKIITHSHDVMQWEEDDENLSPIYCGKCYLKIIEQELEDQE